MGNNDNGGSFALGLLVGGIIGALISLLLAPKPGAETRSEIWERSELWRSRADEAAAGVRDRGGAIAGTVRDAGVSAFDSVASRIGRGQDAAEIVEAEQANQAEQESDNKTQSNNGQESQT